MEEDGKEIIRLLREIRDHAREIRETTHSIRDFLNRAYRDNHPDEPHQETDPIKDLRMNYVERHRR